MLEEDLPPGVYGDGLGLYLRVGPTGSRAWIYRYSSKGVRHEIGLGPQHSVTLADARRKAAEIRRLRYVEGVDPLQARRDGRI